MKSLQPYYHAALLIVVAGLALHGEATRADDSIARSDPYAARKLFYEVHWRGKIESALRYVDGAVVNVDVELTPEMERSVSTRKYDPQTVAEWETVEMSRNEGHSSERQGQSVASSPRSNSSEKETSQVKYLASESQIVTTTAGLIPDSVSVSVSIPTSYYEAVWTNRRHRVSSDENNHEATASSLTNIRDEVGHKIFQTVLALLPRKNPDAVMVRVTSFDDLANSAQRSAAQVRDTPAPLKVASSADRHQ